MAHCYFDLLDLMYVHFIYVYYLDNTLINYLTDLRVRNKNELRDLIYETNETTEVITSLSIVEIFDFKPKLYISRF